MHQLAVLTVEPLHRLQHAAMEGGPAGSGCHAGLHFQRFVQSVHDRCGAAGEGVALRELDLLGWWYHLHLPSTDHRSMFEGMVPPPPYHSPRVVHQHVKKS
jgi:hypothetical protein